MQITTNIEPELYDQAAKILSEIGLTIDDAFNDLLIRIAKEKTYPLPFVPNAETIAAMEELERGEGGSANSIKEFFEAMNEKD